MDGSHFRYHDSADAEPVFAAWGIVTAGKPVLVGLTGGASESTAAWGKFLGGLADRGMRCPLLVISDGAPGLIAAVELHFGKRASPALCDPPGPHLGEGLQGRPGNCEGRLLEDLRRRCRTRRRGHPVKRGTNANTLSLTWRKKYPGAVECLERDLGSLFEHLRFPVEHWKRIRHQLHRTQLP